MTCPSFEKDLALYVERDLPDAAVTAVEAHLRQCAPCRALLDALRASQTMVKDLAAEAIDPDALASLRRRVVAASSSAVPAGRWRGLPPPPMRWASAAALVLAAGGGVLWLALSTHAPSGGPRVAVTLPTAVVPVVPSAPPGPEPSARSTVRAVAAVSPDVGRAPVVRVRAQVDRPAAMPVLSADDADQLARAVVAVSRVQRVRGVEAESEPAVEPTPLVQIATADPNVVIYWRLDSNGGQ